MVDNEKDKCWQNSAEMLSWAPGCGGGSKGKMLCSADLNEGWCDDITTHISKRPGALAPHCIYEVIALSGRGYRYKIRCLYHGAKNAKPDNRLVAMAQSRTKHKTRLLQAKALLILSFGLVLFGLLLRFFRAWNKKEKCGGFYRG